MPRALEVMDAGLRDVEVEVENSEYWKDLISPATPRDKVLAVMREIFLEVWSYQKTVDEAVFTSVGRLGSTIDEQGLIRSMIAMQIEETGHGRLALRDYVALGGDETFATTRRPSPPSLALIGMVRVLGEREHPLCHLGYLYFFEKFTTVMTVKVAPYLQRISYPEDRLEFMRLHAEEDVRHANMIANVIVECEKRYPNASDHILYGFDCFRSVYPHPIWGAAVARAMQS